MREKTGSELGAMESRRVDQPVSRSGYVEHTGKTQEIGPYLSHNQAIRVG